MKKFRIVFIYIYAIDYKVYKSRFKKLIFNNND